VCIAQFALISIGSGYLATVLPLLILAVYLLQKFYLATSRQLRFLDLEYKSPLYSSLTETIEGMSTIRAFGWSRAFETEFLSKLDDSQRPVYMLYCIQRWLNLVLDLIVAALAVLLMAFATQLRGTSSGAALGVAMVSVLGFGQTLGQFIFYYTDLETSLGAIARIREYTTEIVPEDRPGAGGTAPDGWPGKGQIQFESISAAYDPDGELVLKDVSLGISPGQVVGIAGRTGR
jgi:ATP-binding cassette, subfamily C (CFTR/MRP), member 1